MFTSSTTAATLLGLDLQREGRCPILSHLVHLVLKALHSFSLAALLVLLWALPPQFPQRACLV